MGYCRGNRPCQWIQEYKGNISESKSKLCQSIYCSYFMGSNSPDNWFKPLVLCTDEVNNESSEIIRILNSAFDEFLDEKHAKRDFYPPELHKEIDEINSWVYDLYNNGVYKVIPSNSPLIVDWFCISSICLYIVPRSRH